MNNSTNRVLLLLFVFFQFNFQTVIAQDQEGCNNLIDVFSATIEPSILFPNQNEGIESILNVDGEIVLLGLKDVQNAAQRQNLFFEILNADGNPKLAREITLVDGNLTFSGTSFQAIHFTEIIEDNVLAGYAVAATIRNNSLNANRILIMRLDTSGCVEWAQLRTVTVETANDEFARDVVINQFGQILVLIESSEQSLIIAVLERDGDFVQNDKYQLPNIPIEVTSIVEIRSNEYPDLQYLLAGSADNQAFFMPLNEDFSIIDGVMKLIDVDGNADTKDVITSIGIGTGGQLFLGGNTITSSSVSNLFLIDLQVTENMTDNSFGVVNDIYRYNVENSGTVQIVTDVIVQTGNNPVLSGFTFNSENEPSSFIFKVDNQGLFQWANNLEGSSRFGRTMSISNLGSEGILVCGTQWNSVDAKRIAIAKTLPDGTLCNCSSPELIGRSILTGTITMATVNRTRPDWLFSFPNLNCAFLNAPIGFCERVEAQGPSVDFEIETQTIACESTDFCFPVSVKGLANVSDFSLSLAWDPAIFSFKSGTFTVSDFEANGTFDESNTSNGSIGVSWTSGNASTGFTQVDQTTLFEICLNVLDNQREINPISFTNTPLPLAVSIVDTENETLIGEDGLVIIDCEKPCGAFFTADNPNDCGIVQFTDQSIGNIVSHSWTFGDGDSSTDSNPEHSYSSSGTYTVQLTVMDNTGCQDVFSNDIQVVVDNVEPLITCPTAITIDCDESMEPENTGVAIASDNCGIAGLSLTFQNETLRNDPCDGLIRRLWIASDEVGNVSTCEQLIFVVDEVGPVITGCPGQITVNSNEDECNGLVIVSVPTADDACNPVVSFTNDFNNTGDASGLYDAGETIVTWTAIDGCGNETTCQHTVNVLDIVAPTVECLSDTTIMAPMDSAGVVVNFNLPIVEDDCGADLMLSHQPGELFLCGNTVVTYFAVDAAGNQSEVCTFEINVVCQESMCCKDQTDFENRVDEGFSAVVDSSVVWVSALGLNDCHRVVYDWGDNASDTSIIGQNLVAHSYGSPGTYTICMEVEEIDEMGMTCFQKEVCKTICIAFESCEIPQINALKSNLFGSSGMDQITAIAEGLNNDVFVAGTFSGLTDFGGMVRSSIGNKDVFLARYDLQTGELLWVTQAGGRSDDLINDIAIDQNGAVYLAGSFNSKIFTLYSVPSTGGPRKVIENNRINCTGGPEGCDGDAFISKYDANGNLIWGINFGSPNQDQINGITISSENSLYITGGFANSVDFDPGEGDSTLVAGQQDIFVAKYDLDANLNWAFNIGSAADSLKEEGMDIDSDASGNIYITGYFVGNNVDFDPRNNNVNGILSAGATQSAKSAFVAKYNPMGSLIWAYDIQNSSSFRNIGGRKILIHDGQLYLGGQFSGDQPTDFDPFANSPNQILPSFTSSDGFIAMYSLDFDFRWVRGMSFEGVVNDIGVNSQGQIWVGGSFSANQVDLINLSQQTESLFNRGQQDAFIASYQPDGEMIQAINPGGNENDSGDVIWVGPNDNVWLGGSFAGANFRIDLQTDITLSSVGSTDGYLNVYRTVCETPEQCPEFCDFITVDYQFTETDIDSCCVNVLVENNIAETFTALEISAGEPDFFHKIQLLDTLNWNMEVQSPEQVILTPKSNFVGIGSYTPITLCPNSKNSSNSSILFDWVADSLSLCMDTISVACDSITNQCLSIVNDTSYCSSSGLVYEMNWQNLADFRLSEVVFIPISPMGILTDTVKLAFDPPVGIGEVNQTILNFENIDFEDEVCFRIESKDSLRNAYCFSDTICFQAIACPAYVCENTSIQVRDTVLNSNDCCYTIDLLNNCQENFFTGILLEVPESNKITYQSAGEGWGIEKIGANSLRWLPNDGIVDCFVETGKINICLENELNQNDGPITINWLDQEGESFCQDSLMVDCPSGSENNCIILTEQSLTCGTSGGYNLDLGLENTSGFDIGQIELSINDSLTIINIVILQGQVIEIPTLSLEGLNVGDTIRYQFSAFDQNLILSSNYQNSCTSETYELVVPDCVSCECSQWSRFSVADPNDIWPTIGNVSCGSEVNLPDCINEFCIEGAIQCNFDTCATNYYWSLKKEGMDEILLEDSITNGALDFCINLSPDIIGEQTMVPGRYELFISGQCETEQCSNCTFVFNVGCPDPCNPIINCPDDIVLDCPGRLDLPVPTFSDTCGSNKILSCTRSDLEPLDAPYIQDTTLITCIATDELGFKDTCAYRVIVEEQTALSITCPSDTLIRTLPGDTLVAVNFTLPIVSNDCNVTVNYSMNPGSLFGCGMTTVTCMAIDTVQMDTVVCDFEVNVECVPINPCDSLVISGQKDLAQSEEDCCYLISLDNEFTSAQYSGLKLDIAFPGRIAIGSLEPNWSIDSVSADSRTIWVQYDNGNIPLGPIPDILSVCSSNFADQPHEVIISWIGADSTVSCPDTLLFDCVPKACCIDENVFNTRAEQVSLETTTSDCAITIIPTGLGECDEIFFDWDGDSVDLEGPYFDGDTIQHIYDEKGMATVCYQIIEKDVFGMACWPAYTDCLMEMVNCAENCCIDQDNYIDRVNGGFTLSIDNCRLNVTPNSLNECDLVSWDWGDGQTSLNVGQGNTAQFHFFDSSGQYQVCMKVAEINEDGSICWDDSEFCQTIDVNSCNPTCLCGAFTNITFGQNPISIECGQDPVEIACPVEEMPFSLRGQFNCQGNCSPEMVQYQILKDNETVSSGSIMLNSGAINVSLPFGLFREVGTYKVILSGECDGRVCSCEFEIIIPEECDCYCPEIAPLQLIVNDNPITLRCNGDTIIVGCYETDLVIQGSYGCEGDACTDDALINWKLTNPNGIVTVDSIPAGDFSINLMNALVKLAGNYQLEITTTCGVNNCNCVFNWIQEECDPCVCPIEEDILSFDNDCNLVHFYLGGLSECDSIKLIFGDGTGVIATGGDTISHWYPSRGFYSPCYFVKREKENGEICTITDCIPFSIDCFEGFSSNGNAIQNGGFNEGDEQVFEPWETINGVSRPIFIQGEGCDDPNFLSFEGKEFTHFVYQSNQSIIKGNPYNVGICMTSDQVYGLNDFTNLPQIQLVASMNPLSSLVDCENNPDCELIGTAPDLQIEDEWFEMRLLDWVPSEAFNYINVLASYNGVDNINVKVDNIVLSSTITSTESIFGEQFKIYPNPTVDEVVVSFPEATIQNEMLIRLHNVQGQSLVDVVKPKGSLQEVIDLSKFEAGVYLIEVRDVASNEFAWKRVVKY